jgi:hypothetical protein
MPSCRVANAPTTIIAAGQIGCAPSRAPLAYGCEGGRKAQTCRHHQARGLWRRVTIITRMR